MREPPQGFLHDWEKALVGSRRPARTTSETPGLTRSELAFDGLSLAYRESFELPPEVEAAVDPEGSDARYRGAFHKPPPEEPPHLFADAVAPGPKGGGGPPGPEFSDLPPCPCDCECVTPAIPALYFLPKRLPPFVHQLPPWDPWEWLRRKRPSAPDVTVLAPDQVAQPVHLPETSGGVAPSLLPAQTGQLAGAGTLGWQESLRPPEHPDEGAWREVSPPLHPTGTTFTVQPRVRAEAARFDVDPDFLSGIRPRGTGLLDRGGP